MKMKITSKNIGNSQTLTDHSSPPETIIHENSVQDLSLAPLGEKKIEWAWRNMPLLQAIKADFEKTKPFKGVKITLSIHMEAKTACLCRVLAAGGAEMYATGCNTLTTRDEICAALATGEGNIKIYGWYDATPEEYEQHLIMALECGPNIVIDDGGDLVNLLHTKLKHLLPFVYGGCEETTTGIVRLKAMAEEGSLRFPMLLVNNAKCKHLFDNRYGTGQSVFDALTNTTNLIMAGKNIVVAGYGWCGKGVATRAKGMGAKVIITEIDPVKALEASMEGYEVMPMDEAAPIGDIFITVTGCRDIMVERHFMKLKDGAILCNAGHFNLEIDVTWLNNNIKREESRPNIVGYTLPNNKTIFVIAEGKLINTGAGNGHPVEMMDMSFAIQARASEYLVNNHKSFKPDVIPVPEEIDNKVATDMLAACGMSIDKLTPEQEKYLNSWAL